jgi:hypothetical protein
MLETPDAKHKRLKEMTAIRLLIKEHTDVEPSLISMGKEFGGESIEFRVFTRVDLTSLIRMLYLRQGVETVSVGVAYLGRRRGQTITVEMEESFGD